MTIEADFDNVVLPQNLIWQAGECGTRKTTATATVMAMESVAVGIPHLTADTARLFLHRSTRLSTVRGRGPWVQRNKKSINATFLTWDQVRSFIGMRTNAEELSDAQFERLLLRELEIAADRFVRLSVEHSGYNVILNVCRLCGLAELSAEDRRAFTGGKDFRNNTRTFTVHVASVVVPNMSDVTEEALRLFWEQSGIKSRERFNVTVNRIERRQVPN